MQRLFFIENFGSLKLLRSLCLKYKALSKLQDKNLLMIEITACHIINFHNSAFFLSSLFHLILRNKKNPLLVATNLLRTNLQATDIYERTKFISDSKGHRGYTEQKKGNQENYANGFCLYATLWVGY